MAWHPTYLLRESFSFLAGNETGFISTCTPLPPPKKGLAKAKKPLKVRRRDMEKMKQAFPGHITTVQTLAEGRCILCVHKTAFHMPSISINVPVTNLSTWDWQFLCVLHMVK